ncbi:ABC-three component system middle component 1 [Sphingobacterium siyangense]|uniref:Uncharacterized protein n=1 Tax=Sphingobacterium siyangense TaxID=459529 RepID=A0A562M6R3_9SPHI|nr:ABC-three component system middle component 1 [Sphingobacterium siyangense]TWI15512.1 hypothetical protein IQ31_05094 [Sphingobacterium siyangense]
MKNCSDHKDLQSIRNIYQDVSIGLYQETIPGTVNVFTLFFENKAILYHAWKDIYSSVAAYFQTGLPVDAEFERWNIYLLYICRESVDKELQYKIENDRFACRKIVLGDFADELDDNLVNNLISEHITNSDLQITGNLGLQPKIFNKDTQLSQLMNRHRFKTAKNVEDFDIGGILSDLERRFKNEI